MKLRILSMALALLLVLTGAASASQLDPNAEPAQDPLGKYDPPISVTMVHTANDGAFWFPAGDDINSNVYTRRWEETLGIKYSFLWTCPGSQGEEKMNVMIASGDLPDFFAVNRKQFEMLYKAGMLEDLTGAIEQYASKYTKKYLTGQYASLLDVATRDGKTYGLTNGFTYHDTCQMIWIRADWLKKLGLETPKTLADLEVIMDAFVNKDPDGNGANDTYAVAAAGANPTSIVWGLNPSFFNMFHVYPNQWAVEGTDKLQNAMFGPDYRERTRTALLKLQEYYQKGYFHPDFATYDDEMMRQDLFNDKAGIVFMDLWGAYWPLVLHLDMNPNADWVPVPIVSCDDQPAKTSNNMYFVNNIIVAKKGVEHPEAAVKMANLYHDLNNNPETMEFSVYNTDPVDNNQIFLAYPLLIYNPSFNYEGYLAISEAMKTGDTSGLCAAYKMFYEQAIAFRDNKDKSGFPAYRSYTDDGCLGVQNYYMKNKLMQMNEYDGDTTDLMLENDSILKKAWDTMFLTVAMGGDISEYDAFLKLYDEIYAPTVGAEMTAWFQAKGAKSIQAAFEAN